MIPKTIIGDIEVFIADKFITLIQGKDVVVLDRGQFIELKHFTDFEDF